MKFRIVKEGKKFCVEERGLWTLFFWRRWTNCGGSFGDWDVEYESIEKAESAIEIYKKGKTIEVVKWL